MYQGVGVGGVRGRESLERTLRALAITTELSEAAVALCWKLHLPLRFARSHITHTTDEQRLVLRSPKRRRTERSHSIFVGATTCSYGEMSGSGRTNGVRAAPSISRRSPGRR